MPAVTLNNQRIEMNDATFFDYVVGFLRNVHQPLVTSGMSDEAERLIQLLETLTEEISDSELNFQFLNLLGLVRKGWELEKNLIATIANFFQISTPTTDTQIRKVMTKFFKIASSTDEKWKPLFAQYKNGMEKIAANAQAIQAAAQKITERIIILSRASGKDFQPQPTQPSQTTNQLFLTSAPQGEPMRQEIKDLVDAAAGDLNARSAIRHLEKAIAKEIPGIQDTTVYFILGTRYEDMGDEAKAIECYSKAIELPFPNAYAYYFRGQLYQHRGDLAQACQDFEKALTYDRGQGLQMMDARDARRSLDDV